MLVKIKKCRHKRFWYKNLIGSEFQVSDKITEYNGALVVNRYDGKVIFVEDCNYISMIRKLKLKKIEKSKN